MEELHIEEGSRNTVREPYNRHGIFDLVDSVITTDNRQTQTQDDEVSIPKRVRCNMRRDETLGRKNSKRQ